MSTTAPAGVRAADPRVIVLARGCVVLASAMALGLFVGAATFYGQGRLHGAAAALVDSESMWLLAPFAVGIAARSVRLATVAGLIACISQLIGYDFCAQARGYSLLGSMDSFWALAAAVAGPLFGLTGRTWRFGGAGTRGVGPASVVAAFAAEGAWAYDHVLRAPSMATLWLVIAVVFAIVALRSVREWRWLGLTLPLALIVQVQITHLCLGRAW